MNALDHKPLLAFALICFALMLLPEQIRELLYLHIERFKQGEYWRFFSAHLIHYSWPHCLSNIIGLFLLMGIFNDTKQNIHWYFAATIVCIAVSSGLILFSTQLDWYLGFSGVLTGLYAYASIKTFNENTKISMIILIALLVSVVIQLFEGELISSILFVDLNTSSYAHAYGFIAGGLYGVIERCIVCKYVANS
jgi:rhomboid family GlyGly-CTERM serine protease